MNYEIAFNFLLLAVGVFILVRSGVYVVRSLVKIAHFLNVSEFALSFILMAFATTLPEFGVGLNSALFGKPIISLGNILGANILTLGFTLGLVALFSGKLSVDSHFSAAHRGWLNFFLGISPIILLLDGQLTRFDGLILIGLFLFNLARLFRLREVLHHHHSFWLSLINIFENRTDGFDIKYFFKNLFIFIISIGTLLFSSSLVVGAAESISLKIGISELMVGIFIISFGTTLPELSFGLRAAFAKSEELSIGNLFGAAIFNSTWILGIVSFIQPIETPNNFSFWLSATTMILVLFLANLFLWTFKHIGRREGAILVLICLIFAIIQMIL